VLHENEKAQQIGRGQFKKLCLAAGRPVLQRPEALQGAIVIGKINHRKDRESGEMRSFVAKYYPDGTKFDARGNAVETAATPTQQARPPQAPAPATAPRPQQAQA